MLAVCLHLLVKLHSWRAARSTCLFISASFWTFSRLFTAYLSLLIPAPSSTFSVLCISNRAFCLTLKAGNVIFFSQLLCRNSDQSLGVFLPCWHQLPWRYNRLCLQWHRDPQYFPYPFRPGSISVSLPGEDGSPLLRHLLHQLITASGCQLYTGSSWDGV